MNTTTTTEPIPGYVAGTWVIDPVHTEASFSVRHLVGKVRGGFTEVTGEIHTADDLFDSSVTVSIDARSIETHNKRRDDHLRSSDFFEVETYPTLSFTSTDMRPRGEGYLIEGELTIKSVTRTITADLDINGITPGPDGVPVAGFAARFDIDRNDYNVNFNAVLETGGVMVGDIVTIQLDVEAVLQRR